MTLKKQICLLMTFGLLTFGLTAQEKTSENDSRLKGWLKKFPAADKNKDGVLTRAEALDFMKSRRRPGNNKGPTQARTVSGKDVPKGKEIKGYNGLFMGHSFFRPAAEHLLKIVPDTKVVNHTGFIVMSGGASGSPGMLWANENKRNVGLKYLDSGTVEFFAMTYYSKENSSIEHYSKWFDYAIKKNPDITFMVALPWGTFLHQASQAELDKAEKGYKELHDDLIVSLRKKYPKNKVLYCPYGLGVYELISRLKSGKLPGVNHILNPNRSKSVKDQILRDPLGHGTDLVTVLNSLIWIQTIYKYDISSIQKEYRVDGLPDINLNEIAQIVHKKIKPYNAIYK